jgi:putative transposase
VRTVKRNTFLLNKEKKLHLERLCCAYSKEKQHFLQMLRNRRFLVLLGAPRKIRDLLVKDGYQSPYGLQARHWKLALQDAIDTWDSYWKALFVEVRSRLSSHILKDEERHYAYWLLSHYERFFLLMQGKVPQPSFPIEKESARRIAGYVRRTIQRHKKKPPCVQKKKTLAVFDANCYRVFENRGRQYLSLMSLKKGERLIIPLLGNKKIEGNISVILNKTSCVIHQSESLKSHPRPKEEVIEAVDLGYTEAMTDTKGNRYGTKLGTLLSHASDSLNVKMKRRNRLHALEKKLRAGNKRRAKRIRKYNLGRHKLTTTSVRAKASMECEVNKGIHDLFKRGGFSLLVTEDLHHTFTYDASRSMNRRLSYWIRGKIQDRIAFKALAEGFRHEQVNPAYGSQTCPSCGFVDKENRKNDLFMCLNCRYEDLSDRVAAMNYAERYSDREIGRYTPYRHVKTILLDRFHRRLETDQTVTVPGRTLDTVQRGVHPTLSNVFAKPGVGNSR